MRRSPRLIALWALLRASQPMNSRSSGAAIVWPKTRHRETRCVEVDRRLPFSALPSSPQNQRLNAPLLAESGGAPPIFRQMSSLAIPAGIW